MERKGMMVIYSMLLAFAALPAIAQDMHEMMPMDGKVVVREHEGSGTVNSVDAKAGRVNITHGPIATLGWEGMTMDFEVQDKAMLVSLKKGQKVRFKLVEVRKGDYAISEISAAK